MSAPIKIESCAVWAVALAGGLLGGLAGLGWALVEVFS